MELGLYPKYLIRSLFVHGKHNFFKAGYKLIYPEYSRHGMTPWQHYVIDGKRKGFGTGNNPTDNIFFREGYELEYPDVVAAEYDPWRHYAEKGHAEGRDNGLHPNGEQFLSQGYIEMYPDIVSTGMDPWHHYVLIGKKEGRDNGLHPNAEQFFTQGYLEMYPDVVSTGMDPWHHYVLTGKKEGKDNGLHPNDDQFFAQGYLEMYHDVVSTGMDPWHHYVRTGKKEGRDNGLHPTEGMFFAEGYLEMYPDVAAAGVDPWHHYVLAGKKEGRDNGLHPDGSQFFPEGYLEMYPDSAASGMDPWHHYVLTGKEESRDNGLHPTEEMFFAEGYLELYPDVAAAGADPWHHYVLTGAKEGRDNGLHPRDDIFFAEGYLEMYPDAAKAGADPWHHYVLTGKKDNRDNGLHPDKKQFCAESYLLNYPFARNSGTDPWRHYVLSRRNKENNWLDDYCIRLAGHEQEYVRTVYLTPFTASRKNPKRRHKALLIGHEFSVSGATLSLLGIAKILESDGYFIDIAVKDINQSRNIGLYDGLGADVFLLPNSADCFPNADQIVRNYDLVIVNTIVMGSYATLCKKLNIPHIWFIREDLSVIRLVFDAVKSTKQDFFSDVDNILCVSKYVADSLFNEYKINCRYINNFIYDLPESYNRAPVRKNRKSAISGIRTFAVVGSVESRKSQQSVAAAFLYISSNTKYKGKWKLFFIGKYGKDCNDPSLGIKLQAATKNLPGIVWCGEVTENKWELFKSIDFFIIPSLEEASSRVAIESAMLGKPVICTTHVGAKYLTENNAGMLFKPGDTVELRTIIEKCIDMPEDEYRQMSHQARLNYEKTSSPEVYCDAFYSIIRDKFEKSDSSPEQAENPFNSSFRTLGSGKNAFSIEVQKGLRLEYVNFVDFANYAGNQSSKSLPESSSKTGVVVPVMRRDERLKALVRSLFSNTDLPHCFIFVDGCPDEGTGNFLKGVVSRRDDCILIRTGKKLDLVNCLNIGAEKALESCSNFVLLDQNSDVPSGWLGRLIQPIKEDEGVSSVIPFSNSCSMFSFPFFEEGERNNAFLSKFGLDGINSAMLNSSAGRYTGIPACCGFCMAFSGKAWRKIGGLNAELFDNLDGAQKEWSLRAGLDGFRSILASELYVAHYDDSTIVHEENKSSPVQDILSVMFPSYESRVKDFIREYPLSEPIVSMYLSLARQKGYKTEIFTESSPFMARMTGDDGIFVLMAHNITKLAVRLLGNTILVGNAMNLDRTGIL